MDQEKLFQDYIAICNKALEVNKNQFPFGQILSAVQSAGKITPTQVEIIDDVSCLTYEMHLADNGLDIKPKTCGNICAECAASCPNKGSTKWQVKASYLNHVVSNSDHYIDNPARLNWEWITSAR